jgi:hypothetical protein
MDFDSWRKIDVSMQIGVVTKFDSRSEQGSIEDTNGRVFEFSYQNGENLVIDVRHPCPQFTGRHAQSPGFQLKLPRTGDAVLFVRNKRGELTWGYVEHFTFLLLRRHGTEFGDALAAA